MLGAAFPFIPTLTSSAAGVRLLWPNGYRYRMRRVIPAAMHQQPTGAAGWVKYRITNNALRSVANLGHVANDAAWPDIRFENGNGTVIPYDLESWNATTGALVVWLLLSGFVDGANYTVLLNYGKVGITSNEANATACWAGYGQSVNMATGLDMSGNQRHFTLTNVTVGTIFGGAAGDFA